jgi:NAD(P)-dependent dehydrogenase (short-subunit alcohol dehydrogenase family)
MSTINQSKIVPKKVLVTGASGLLGVAAIEKFLAAGDLRRGGAEA